ncbi:alpha-beta hydrolase superfamily lysophospholipase [Labedaea rhizosphaerae]|uniref:Alpha-beta hydrolase superfamily lysophospholipase n=2 Tax=Labedaea rhizosphaerae TaxID=598644 RepID=A0A4R6RXN2_LABRH|nr:alpha-beta hydrolase superfamily lysophospholipase [Labedaea rhizosphaerae]
MQSLTSADGTKIAFDRLGAGPPLIVVLGAFNSRASHMEFAQALAEHFTVYHYDRRGRGESGDTLPWSVEREVEDIAALAEHAGGEPLLFGYSSGAVLALKAAAALRIGRLALYDTPLTEQPDQELPKRLAELIERGDRGGAVELFQLSIGIPEEVVAQLRNAPFRPGLEAMAHTLVYETSITADPEVLTKDAPAITVPTLLMAGAGSGPIMTDAAARLSNAIPDATVQVLDGQTHDIVPDVIVPRLREFFGAV